MPTTPGRCVGRSLMIRAARVLLALVICVLSVTAEAHGFAERYDLPVPLRLYVGGSAAAVALSFVVVAYFVRGDRTVQRYPTFNLLGTVAGRILASRALRFVLRFFALFMLVLVVVAGLIGDDDQHEHEQREKSQYECKNPAREDTAGDCTEKIECRVTLHGPIAPDKVRHDHERQRDCGSRSTYVKFKRHGEVISLRKTVRLSGDG